MSGPISHFCMWKEIKIWLALLEWIPCFRVRAPFLLSLRQPSSRLSFLRFFATKAEKKSRNIKCIFPKIKFCKGYQQNWKKEGSFHLKQQLDFIRSILCFKQIFLISVEDFLCSIINSRYLIPMNSWQTGMYQIQEICNLHSRRLLKSYNVEFSKKSHLWTKKVSFSKRSQFWNWPFLWYLIISIFQKSQFSNCNIYPIRLIFDIH